MNLPCEIWYYQRENRRFRTGIGVDGLEHFHLPIGKRGFVRCVILNLFWTSEKGPKIAEYTGLKFVPGCNLSFFLKKLVLRTLIISCWKWMPAVIADQISNKYSITLVFAKSFEIKAFQHETLRNSLCRLEWPLSSVDEAEPGFDYHRNTRTTWVSCNSNCYCNTIVSLKSRRMHRVIIFSRL